jgi:hypothetical protein
MIRAALPHCCNMPLAKCPAVIGESDVRIPTRPAIRLLFVAALGLSGFGAHAAPAPSYDLVIRNGHVIDGTGSPWYAADIAIRDGRIAAIGRLGDVDAKQVIDAHGMVVAPGFIGPH